MRVPYSSLCSSQCTQSGDPDAGISRTLPIIGSGFGPGGRMRDVRENNKLIKYRLARPATARSRYIVVAVAEMKSIRML